MALDPVAAGSPAVWRSAHAQRRRVRLLPLPLLLLGAAAAARADEPRPAAAKPQDVQELAAMSLDELLDIQVVTASKSAQKLTEAPAIVSVISGDEIRTWGYRSVAEALATVPGFYGIDDFLSPNFGIRGVNGGQRAYNRIMKVMINGVPVSSRPDSTNLLGPELIPMEAVDHIEVVRGPASALYGANAYLGVVNIITKQPQKEQLGAAVVRAGGSPGSGLASTPGWFGGDLLLAPAVDNFSLLVSGSFLRADRSGYAIPAGSPGLTTGAYAGDTTSQNDQAKPGALFAQAGYRFSDALRVSAQASYSHLSADGELLDFGTMSHQNLVVIDNFIGQAKVDWSATDRLSLTAAAGVASGGPTSKEHLYAGDPQSHPSRDLGYLEVSGLAEGKYGFRERDSATLGVDFASDTEQLLTAYAVANDGTQTPSSGAAQGKKTFSNFGAYGQLVTYPLEARKTLGVTGNLRFDYSNDYGSNVNWRAGLVDQLSDALSVKLLAGSSYKAPSAVQRYAQPLYVGDVIGNQALKPETAATVEAQASFKATDSLLLSVNAYRTHVSQKVELVPNGSNTSPQNAGSVDSLGLESEARFVFGHHQLMAGFQWQKTDDNTDDPFRSNISAPSASYPVVIANAGWQYRDPTFGSFNLRGRYASERRSSKSNTQIDNLRPYALGAYALADAAWSLDWKMLRFSVQATNLFNTDYSEPGYAGIDFPGHKRELGGSCAVKF
jgi:iron complex outermembrane receptor protein